MPGGKATREQVAEFLTAFKAAMDLGFWHLKNREKNLQGIEALGLTINGAKETIGGLTPANYVSGPEPDDTDASKEVWVFGAQVDQTEVYIKLRLAQDPRRRNVRWALTWSFHPAERPLRYPLQGGPK